MQGGGAGAAAASSKDGHASARSFVPVMKLVVRPVLLFSVLATGFLAAALILFLVGGGPEAVSYYRFPTVAVPNVVPAAPCSEEEVKVDRWWARRAARSAWHNMSDEELLWAASFEPRRSGPGRPSAAPGKVAFLFLTRGPLPLAPLWERFFNGTGGKELFSVYVHTTPGYRLHFPPSSPFHRRQVPSKATWWGDGNVMDAERCLLANALLDLANQRFVLISESCIPLRPFPVVHAYLTSSHHSFVEAFDDPSRLGRGRYRIGLAPEVHLSQWRKGAQWFELDRHLAVFVVADVRYYPKFREACLAPCYVDEHYLPTVLTIWAPSRLANRSVTWVDWSRGGSHPASFGAEDVGEEFLARLVRKKGEKDRGMYNGKVHGVMVFVCKEVCTQCAAAVARAFHQDTRILA